jgi:type I restriction enzyme M protein
VKIKLPPLHYQNKFAESLGEQKAKIEGLKEASVKLKLLQAERNALAHGMGNLLYENFASVKHSLGKPLLNIGSSLRNIENALVKLDKEWENFKLSEKHDITLKDSFESIYSNLELIHSLLKNNERDFDVSNYKLTELDFMKFIKTYVKK